MEKLTEQILDFARTGKVDPQPEDPAEVARAAVDESGQAGVDLFIKDGLPPWPMDRLRIERVLINLVKNGVQASPPEAVVDLTVKTEEDGLVFEVRDRGTGLPPGEEEWIFEPFHIKRVRGTGLGLAVTKRIVEAHDGLISARNHPEGGAVFRVWLPPAEVEEASE
jgi:signal transduction histidine kinase